MATKLYYIVEDTNRPEPYVRFNYWNGKKFQPLPTKARYWSQKKTAEKHLETLQKLGKQGLKVDTFELGR